MANLKEIRTRITSVSSTQQITKAMKMVSAAKLKRATDAIIQLRPYANKLKEVLESVSANMDEGEGSAYTKHSAVKSVLLVAITSNRGLCGGFNANIIKKVNSVIKSDFDNAKISLLCVGKKADEAFKKTEYHILGTDMPRHVGELFDNLTYDNVTPIAENLMNHFKNGDFDKIILVYNQFKNAAIQQVTVETFLPIAKPESNTVVKSKKAIDYIMEPSQEVIVNELIPRSLKIQFYKALLDSHASEHGARMTAMHKATDNAGAMIKELKLTYNKARQASITNEILEIVGGAEALKG